ILIGLGAALGRTAHFHVEGIGTHYLNEFAVLVGQTSKARKGSSWIWARKLLENADPHFVNNRIVGGLSSGEGLIWAVRDPIRRRSPIKERGRIVSYEEVEDDPGVSDKRLLAMEPEFATVLRRMEVSGNTLSAILRLAWESSYTLQALTKNSSAKATE